MNEFIGQQQESSVPPEHEETTSIGGREYTISELREHVEKFPEEDVPLDSLRAAVGPGHVYWIDRDGMPLAPAQIIEDWEAAQKVEAWADHVESIKRADFSKPIWVMVDGSVFDGVHRLTRAVLDNRTTIKARIVTSLPEYQN